MGFPEAVECMEEGQAVILGQLAYNIPERLLVPATYSAVLSWKHQI